MNKILLALLLAASCGVVSAQPRARFLSTNHDFGAFHEEDGLARCEFILVNDGTSPLTIISARATCGCTTPEYSRKPIAPGDTARVAVAYDPAGRPGRFNKTVYVETDGVPSKSRLDIRGVVIGSDESVGRRYPVEMGPLRLAKPVLALGDATKGRLKSVYLEGYNRSDDSLNIKVKNVPPYLDIVFAPEVAAPGEQVTLIAYVSAHKGAPYGVVEDTLTIVPVPGLEFELPAIVTVQEDFSKMDAAQMEKAPIAVPETERVELGRVDRSGAPVETSFKLTNAGKSDLKIRRVYSVDKGVKVTSASETVKKGKSTEIKVVVNPAMQEGSLLNNRIQIITNDPLHPVYTVRLVGEWSE